ncbi:MAG: hypothetical protein ACPIB2_06305, partial [Flavobacteriaceae bacterium]
RFLGKEEVGGSNPLVGSLIKRNPKGFLLSFLLLSEILWTYFFLPLVGTAFQIFGWNFKTYYFCPSILHLLRIGLWL